MSYFTRWWEEQTDSMKDRVRALLRNGQLEIANGGWVMNDEACAHYEDVLAQMTLGH